MDWSTPGFPVPHYHLEFAQTHVHWVSDSIQPFHLLLPPSPPTFTFSKHQGLFQWVNSVHQVAKVLRLQLQHQSFQRIFKVDFPEDWLIWSPCSSRDSQESSLAPQVESISSSAFFMVGPILTFIHSYIQTIALTVQTFVSKEMSLLFNMLSRFVIAFLPRSKHLLISRLRSPSAVIL